MPEPTTAISVRGKDPVALRADPNFIYVGRAVPRIGWEKSKWANPFKVGMDFDRAMKIVAEGSGYNALRRIRDADEAVRLFQLYAWVRAWDVRAPDALRGKILGCWCGDWRPGEPEIACHAVVLAKLADAMETLDA